MQQLKKESGDWDYIKFRIQLLVASSNIQILQVQKLSSLRTYPQLAQFMNIDAAIDATHLSQQQINKLIMKKEHSPIFQTGYIHQQNQIGSVHRMLLLKLAVRNIITIAHDPTKDAAFPQSTDTIYYSQIKQQFSLFNHQFSVSSPNQYQIQYDVKYRYVNQKKFSNLSQKCQYCQQTATTYCIQQNQFFCTSCFQSNHRSVQKQTHTQQPITPFNAVPFCPNHKQQRMQIYCFQCKRIVCPTCMLQEHQKHQSMGVIQMTDSFSLQQQSALKQLKSKVNSVMSEVEKKIQLANIELGLKQRELQQNFKIKLMKIRQESGSKVCELVGLHSLLVRKYDEYLWIEKFVNYVSDYLLTQENMQIKEAFSTYVKFSSPKEEFKKIQKLLNNIQNR